MTEATTTFNQLLRRFNQLLQTHTHCVPRSKAAHECDPTTAQHATSERLVSWVLIKDYAPAEGRRVLTVTVYVTHSLFFGSYRRIRRGRNMSMFTIEDKFIKETLNNMKGT